MVFVQNELSELILLARYRLRSYSSGAEVTQALLIISYFNFWPESVLYAVETVCVAEKDEFTTALPCWILLLTSTNFLTP